MDCAVPAPARDTAGKPLRAKLLALLDDRTEKRPGHGEHCRDKETGEIACGWPELHEELA